MVMSGFDYYVHALLQSNTSVFLVNIPVELEFHRIKFSELAQFTVIHYHRVNIHNFMYNERSPTNFKKSRIFFSFC